jgi:hypothetical protein
MVSGVLQVEYRLCLSITIKTIANPRVLAPNKALLSFFYFPFLAFLNVHMFLQAN